MDYNLMCEVMLETRLHFRLIKVVCGFSKLGRPSGHTRQLKNISKELFNPKFRNNK
jgi:hypothetical protein